jgi:hypothetical protein
MYIQTSFIFLRTWPDSGDMYFSNALCNIFSWSTKPRLTKQYSESFVKLKFFSSYYYYRCHKNIKWNNKNKTFKTLDDYCNSQHGQISKKTWILKSWILTSVLRENILNKICSLSSNLNIAHFKFLIDVLAFSELLPKRFFVAKLYEQNANYRVSLVLYSLQFPIHGSGVSWHTSMDLHHLVEILQLFA